MKPKPIFLFACSLFIFWACNNSKNETAGTDDKSSDSSAVQGTSKVKQLSDAFFFDVLEKKDTNKLKEILADNFIGYDYTEPDANSNKTDFIKDRIFYCSTYRHIGWHISH